VGDPSLRAVHYDCQQVSAIFQRAGIDPLVLGQRLHGDDQSWEESRLCAERLQCWAELSGEFRKVIEAARKNRDIDVETVTPGLLLFHLVDAMPVNLDSILAEQLADRPSLKRAIAEVIPRGSGAVNLPLLGRSEGDDYAVAIRKLDSLIGLTRVKAKVRRQVNFLRTLKMRSPSASAQSLISSHHCVFTGRPGTGKTTVARLMGEIFYALGITTKRLVYECRRSTLVGSHLGETEAITRRVLAEAEGGILFIDEAQELLDGKDDQYGKLVLQELQKQMEDKRDRLVVILAGYGEALDRVLSYNPGFRSRFPRRNLIHFDDYNPVELAEIFQQMAAEQGFQLDPEFTKKLLIHTSLVYDRKNSEFGNGREMRNLLEEVIEEHFDQVQGAASNQLPANLNLLKANAFVSEFKLEVDDLANGPDAFVVFCANKDCQAENPWSVNPKERLTRCRSCNQALPPAWFGIYKLGGFYDETRKMLVAREDKPPLQRLDALIGLASVKEHVRVLHARFLADKERRRRGRYMNPEYGKHLVFTGRPGTGKTTVARLIGQIYREIGFLTRGHVKECKGADLIAGYIGQSAALARAQIREALDGILFIDEAYGLLPGEEYKSDFGGAVINTLLTEMQDNQRRLVVILAGYKDRLDELWTSNAGLRSRFPEKNHIEFPDYTAEELTTIFINSASRQGFQVDDDLEQMVREYFSDPAITSDKTFANARTAEQELSAVIDRQSARIMSSQVRWDGELFQLRAVDFELIQKAKRMPIGFSGAR
jgi:SpoVK/Ycf46/Vps4 family AAA+-type ATPase